MSDFDVVRTHIFTLLAKDKDGNTVEVATTTVVENNRGQMARVSTTAGDGFPAESESVPGKGAWKNGEILIQHLMHDGRGLCKMGVTGAVDGDGGLSWIIDSVTNDASGAPGQKNAAPLVLNAGEAKGMYVALYPIDNTVSLQDRAAGVSIDRMPMADLIAKLKGP